MNVQIELEEVSMFQVSDDELEGLGLDYKADASLSNTGCQSCVNDCH